MKENVMDELTPTEVTCIICQRQAPFIKATAGALYADGSQAFACLEHAWNKASWLLAWARFAITQNKSSEDPHKYSQMRVET